jgi:hypothetical protein
MAWWVVSHHVDPGSIPGSGVVICDLVDALCIALPMRVFAISLQYMITKWGKVNMRIRPSAPGHITSHNRVTEILNMFADVGIAIINIELFAMTRAAKD